MLRLFSILLLWVVFLKCVLAQAEHINIRDMGAVGDGATLNTRIIQTAIDSAARQGGGTVYVPPGVFVTGTLQLRSNVNLRFESGAVLKGSANLNDYLLNGKRVGLLFTQDAENVSITGLGTIDGNGDSFMELDKAKKMDHAGVMWTRQGDQFRHVSEGIGDGPVVPKDRPYQMIIFSDCRKVTVRDVLIMNSPFWTLLCADCDGVIISGSESAAIFLSRTTMALILPRAAMRLCPTAIFVPATIASRSPATTITSICRVTST